MTFVKVLPVLKDNYSFLLCESSLKLVFAIDPVVPNAILEGIKDLGSDWTLGGILTTHHHWDHSGGNLELLAKYPCLTVYGGDERIPGLTEFLNENSRIKFGNLQITPISTPCHTSGSISYFLNSSPPLLFTGDTLFKGGCGRFFEGSPKDMYTSLQKLKSLPDETLVYPGHEYTLGNLNFAKTIDSKNSILLQELEYASRTRITIPSSIQLEKQINPFMRVDLLKESLGYSDGIDAIKRIRELKDCF